MSFTRVWIHFVFSTKNRNPILDKSVRYEIFDHIKKNATAKDIYLDKINGWVEHCHCLISLNKEMSISKTMQLIKGESSHWINKNKLISDFAWQDDYYAIGVSESNIDRVRLYIENQEKHHAVKSFNQEYDELIKLLEK